MSSSWIAFRGQQFCLQLHAYDPENQTITYSTDKPYKNVMLSAKGVFEWIPKDTKSREFIVKAIDKCGAEASLPLKIEVRECRGCEEGKICVLSKNATGTTVVCQCPSGCTGKWLVLSMYGPILNWFDLFIP